MIKAYDNSIRIKDFSYKPNYSEPRHYDRRPKISFILSGALKEKSGHIENFAAPMNFVLKPNNAKHSDWYGPKGARVLSIDWREDYQAPFLQERSFEEYKWYNSNFHASLAIQLLEVVRQSKDGQSIDYLVKSDKSMQSAGGLITTAEDAALWLKLQLNEGKVKGKQIFSKKMIESTHQKLAKIGDQDRDGFGRSHYGIGWRIGTFNGHANINHFGGYPGYASHISFDPEAKIGVAVFANEGYWGDNLMNLFASFIYDYLYIKEPNEVIASYEKKKTEIFERIKTISGRIEADLEKRSKRTWNLDDPFPHYSGTYVNDILGTLEIKGFKDRIEVRNGNLKCEATPFPEKNSIRIELIPGRGNVIFFKYEDGKVVGMKSLGLEFKKV